jgi:hypothetical protein
MVIWAVNTAFNGGLLAGLGPVCGLKSARLRMLRSRLMDGTLSPLEAHGLTWLPPEIDDRPAR